MLFHQFELMVGLDAILSIFELIPSVTAHINVCDGIKHSINLMFLNTSVDGDVTKPDHRDMNINIAKNIVRIIDSHSNWNVLLHKEAIRIKELKPLLNIGLKASKELNLF